MNNKYSDFGLWKRRKTISTRVNLFAQHFRNFTIPIVLVAILITSLFGCAQATPIVIAATPTPEVISPTATPTTPPTETPVPIPTETPFVPQATLKIAIHVPLSGGGSNDGAEVLRAAELAGQQLAGPLRELGYGIELVSYDDQSNVEISVANAKEIVANPKILCGVGHLNSSVMVQASEIYHNAGLAFISPASTSTTVTDRYYPEVNRLVGRDDSQGIAGAQFAHSQGFTRVFVLHSDSSSSEKNADYFNREAYRLGISVIGITSTEKKENFTGTIRRVLAANPDMVYVASKVDQAGPFIREARDAGYMGVFLGTDGVNRSALAELAGPALAEGGGMYYTETVAPAGFYSEATQFGRDYESRYGSIPRIYAAQAYDATGICLKGIEEASKAIDGKIPSRKNVATAIRAIQDYPGITGLYRFNHKGDINPAKYYVFKVVSANPDNWSLNTIVATFEVEPPR